MSWARLHPTYPVNPTTTTHRNKTALLGVREPVIPLGTATFSKAAERIRTDGELGHFFLSHKLVQIGEGQAFRRWSLKETALKPLGSTKEAALAKNVRVSGFLWLFLSSAGGVVVFLPAAGWSLGPSGPLRACWDRNSASSPSPSCPHPSTVQGTLWRFFHQNLHQLCRKPWPAPSQLWFGQQFPPRTSGLPGQSVNSSTQRPGFQVLLQCFAGRLGQEIARDTQCRAAGVFLSVSKARTDRRKR